MPGLRERGRHDHYFMGCKLKALFPSGMQTMMPLRRALKVMGADSQRACSTILLSAPMTKSSQTSDVAGAAGKSCGGWCHRHCEEWSQEG